MSNLFRRHRPGSSASAVMGEDRERGVDESRRYADNAVRVEASERAARDQAVGNEQRRQESEAKARRQSHENELRRQTSDAEARRQADKNEARYRSQDGSS